MSLYEYVVKDTKGNDVPMRKYHTAKTPSPSFNT